MSGPTIQSQSARQATSAVTGRGIAASWCPLETYRNVFAQRPRGLDAWWESSVLGLGRHVRRGRAYMKRGCAILQRYERLADQSRSALTRRVAVLAQEIRLGKSGRDTIDEAMAMMCVFALEHVGLLPHPVQIAAALAMWDQQLVELATGEGKTLSVAMAATLAGWQGRGCHIITTNDYLAQRDAQQMMPYYNAMGLRAAWLDSQMAADQRREAYAQDVTYVPNKELLADYLRDCLALGSVHTGAGLLLQRVSGKLRERRGMQQVMGGLAVAIVDEADSVLLDDAATPLIISKSQSEVGDPVYQAMSEFVKDLKLGKHYTALHDERVIKLTPEGNTVVQRWRSGQQNPPGRLRAAELARSAIAARTFFERDRHYIVSDGEVVILDEFTGRMMPDRRWREGMHQAIEAKEGLTVRPMMDTLSRISFQRFFRIYPHLCGTTGTAWEQRRELWKAYHQHTIKLPTHRPCVRIEEPDDVYPTQQQKWEAVVAQVKQLHAVNRPVLIGTRSVMSSERLSAMLQDAGLPHNVLNAVRHQEEARIVEQAGAKGQITVATNMAGRGTDIKIDPEVAKLGGLCVIATERHESRRIDRQLIGRCARQGDPGSYLSFVSLEDELIVRFAPWWGSVMLKSVPLRTAMGQKWARLVFSFAQRKAQHQAARARAIVQRSDDWLEDALGFADRTF